MRRNDDFGDIVIRNILDSAEVAKASRARGGASVEAIRLDRSQVMAMAREIALKSTPVKSGDEEAAITLKFIQQGYSLDDAMLLAEHYMECGATA
jgi:hypothetical protein